MILRTNWMINSIYLLFVLCVYLQSIKVADTRAVVFTEDRSSRLIREIYPEEVTVKQAKANYCLVGDVVYATGEAVGSSDPCEQCECRGPGVECSPMTCPPPNPGCRALHRPDICCPSYQCECTFGNRTYANGERLEETPNGPCKVCYCRGGEIQCNDVGCYTRDDCEPVQVPGQCCPKYDNCPPRDHASSSTESIPSSSSSETFELNESDGGKIPSDEIINSSYESAQSGQITSFEDVSPMQSAEIQETSTKSIIKELPIESRPKITIKEVIAPPKREINVANTYNENTDNIPKGKDNEEKVRTEVETKNEYPESESYEHPASVIRVGNDVIIYEGGQIKPGHDLSSTPASFINVIGAEGLQIGGVDDIQNDHFHNFGSSTEEPRILSSESTPTTENLAYLKESDEMAKLNTDVIYKESQEKVSPTLITTVKKQLVEDQLTSEGPTRIPISFEGYSSTSNVDDDLMLESSMKQERESFVEDGSNNNNNPIIPHEKSKDEINENISERNPAYPPLPDDVDVLLPEPNEEDLDAYKISHVEHVGIPSNNPLINSNAALPLSLLKSYAPTDPVDDIIDEETSSSTTANEISTKSDDSKILLTSDNMLDILNYIGNITNNDSNETDNKTLFDISTQDYSDNIMSTTTSSVPSSSERISTKNSLFETITTENSLLKSKETLEENEDSDERVTEKTQFSPFMSVEDASIHQNPGSALSSDVELLITQSPETSNNDDNSASEQKSSEVPNNNSYELKKDIEMIETNNTTSGDTKSYDALQNNDENTDDSSLNDSSQIVPSSSEDGLSIENGTQSSVEVVPYRTSQENELLMKVSDAISKFKLHESTDSLDINVLNILKDFLDKQAKSFK